MSEINLFSTINHENVANRQLSKINYLQQEN